MNIEWFRDYCISLKGVTEEFPFGEETLVFKVMGKMFALTDVDLFTSVNLKCDPEKAVQLREQHAAIQPGYHMNKNHWNTVLMDGTLSDKFVKELINDSYTLVVSGLTKKLKGELEKLP
ncbi:MmcQ/YjbR family DNA-binding protein [Fulvivirga ligni]|uniref:MmcQ/YjbR family DNA-binding protein n=1 Tax=Fulvivirga ligni TaxID=2904246 RepID=UPI001F4168B7|nr:MmcQ/YjbR family DNA-binding protein [Fulvivirga ligni]UII24162.1 MmcQ/YjbR family DNA-binding protein [Fulvivirga ligni]